MVSFNAAPSVTITTPNPHVLLCGKSSAIIDYQITGGTKTEYAIVAAPPGSTVVTSLGGLSNFITATETGKAIPGFDKIGTYILRYRQSTENTAGGCLDAYADIKIVVSSNAEESNAGTRQVLECKILETTLAGNSPDQGVGKWSQVTGPNVANIADPLNPGTKISDLVNGIYVFRWIITNGEGACSNTQDDVEVVVSNGALTTSAAGQLQETCFDTPVTLAGNVPNENETGTWTAFIGSTKVTNVEFSDINDPKAVVTGLLANTQYTFTWTIKNTCGASSASSVGITVSSTVGPKQAVAKDLCFPTSVTTFNLDGNQPDLGETGTWTYVNGPKEPTIANVNLFNTSVSNVIPGVYIFEWKLSRGTCSPTVSRIKVIISASPTVAIAGTNQNVCGTTATMAGNIATVGTGKWIQIEGAGGAKITDPSSPTTTITNLTAGRYKFAWTISNEGTCSVPSTAQVTINVSIPSSLADAGTDILVCDGNTTTLNAVPVTNGTGRWVTISGPNIPVYADLTNPKTVVSGLIYGSYKLQWISSGGLYCPESTDDMTVTVRQNAYAGADQLLCNTNTVSLLGNFNSVGTWSVVGIQPSVTIVNDATNGAVVTGLAAGTYTFRYTIAAVAGCPATFDEVTYTISPAPSVADAGRDQSLCLAVGQVIPTFRLAGNTPDVGTGSWTILEKPAGSTPNLTAPASGISDFTTTTPGIYLLQWEIKNNGCAGVTASNDLVKIMIFAPANAGPDQIGLNCVESFRLSANQPLSGTGIWTLKPGAPNTPIIANIHAPETTVTGIVAGSYDFVWTLDNNDSECGPSADEVRISVSSTPPNIAIAGDDKTICVSDGSYTLSGNPPAGGTETGSWQIVSRNPAAASGILVNPLNFNATINNLEAGVYTLRWTLKSGSCESSDDMVLTVLGKPTESQIISATPLNPCQYESVVLTADAVTVGIGTWSAKVPDGAPTPIFDHVNGTITSVFGLVPGKYQFVFTTSNGSCNTHESAPIEVEVSQPGDPSVAGITRSICIDEVINLGGNSPSGTGLGTWTVVDYPLGAIFNIDNVNDPAAKFNANLAGDYTLIWTIAYGGCTTESRTQVTITPKLIENDISSTITKVCEGGSAEIKGSTPKGGTGEYTYMWQQSIDGAAFTNLGGTRIDYIAAPINANIEGDMKFTYRRVAFSGDCATSFSNEVSVIVPASIRNHQLKTEIRSYCYVGDPSVIEGVGTPTGGNKIYTYKWERSIGSGTYSEILGETGATYDPPLLPENTGVDPIVYNYRRTVTSEDCSKSAVMAITINPKPKLSSPAPGEFCSNTVFTYQPLSQTKGTTFTWKRAGVNGISNAEADGVGKITETLINTTNKPIVVNYVYTLAANGCVNPTTFTVPVTINPSPIGKDDVAAVECDGLLNYNLQGNIDQNVTGIPSTFEWTVVENAGVTGEGSGNGTAINQALFNNTSVAQQVVYTIVPKAIDGKECPGQPFTLTVTVPVCPGMTITKKTSRTTDVTQKGDVIPYEIVITNTGNADQTNVIVKDPFLSAAALIRSLDTGNGDDVLNKGEVWTYKGDYIVTQQDLDNNGKPSFNSGKITNIASVESKELPVPKTDETTVDIKAVSSYSVDKASTTNEITHAGQLVPYTITVENTGNTAISNVVIDDPMLTNITLSKPVAPIGDLNGNNKLDYKEIWVYTGTHTVTQAEMDANGNVSAVSGMLRNIVAVTGDKPDGDPVYPDPVRDEVNIPIKETGSFEITKNTTTDAIRKKGQVVPYTITVANTGKVAITNIKVIDPLFDPAEFPASAIYSGDINKNMILDVNETWTYRGDYAVKQQDLDEHGNDPFIAGQLVNTASVSGVLPNTKPITGESKVTVPVKPYVAYTIKKDSDVKSITEAGQKVAYTIIVKNTGDAAISDVVVTDDMLTLSGPTGDGLTLGKLDVGEIWTYTGTYDVKQTDLDENGNDPANVGVLTNVAKVSGKGPNGVLLAEEESVKLIPINTSSELDIVKTANLAAITKEGELVTYTIAVKNVGKTSIKNVVLTDPMIAGTITGPAGDGGTLTVLEVGETWYYTGTYMVKQEDIDNQGNYCADGKLINIAQVTGDRLDGTNAGSKTAIVELPINPVADFVLTKTSNVGVVSKVGDPILYTVTAENTGTVAINSFVVTDPMLSLIYKEGDLNSDGKLDVGETWTYEGTYKVTQEDIDNNGNGFTSGKLVNIASASGRKPDGKIAKVETATANVDVVPVSLIGMVKSTTTVRIEKAGQEVPYLIVVANKGTVAISDVKVSDPMLTNLAYSNGDVNLNNKLDVNETWTYTGTYTITQQDIDEHGNDPLTPGQFVNTASVSGVLPDTKPITEESTVSIPVKPYAAYTIKKDSDVKSITEEGQKVAYTIRVKNTGDVAITDVVVTDNMLTLSGPTGDGLTLGKLDVGETWTYTGTYDVQQTDLDKNGNDPSNVGVLTNVAKVLGKGSNGVLLAEEESVKLIPINTSSELIVVKTADLSVITKEGEVVTYTISVKNEGKVAINNVVLNDPMIAGTVTGPTGDGGALTVLEVGETWYYTGTYIVKQEDIDNQGNYCSDGKLTNIANFKGKKPDGTDVGSTTAILELPINPAADFILNKTSNVSKVTKVGDLIVYRVTAENTAAVAINSLVVTDPMLSLIYKEGDLNSDGKLDVRETWTYEGTYKVTQEDIDNNGNGFTKGKLVNTVSAGGRKPDGTLTGAKTATANVDVVPVSLMEMLKSSTTTQINKAGQLVPYSIAVANKGTVAISNVQVSDPMLTDLAYSNGDVNLNKKLDVGETWTYTGNYTVSQLDIDNRGNTSIKGNLINTATVSGDNPDGSASDPAISTKNIPVVQTNSVDFTKVTTGQVGYKAGETVTYEIKVTNTGNTTLKNLVVTDDNAIITKGSPIAVLNPGAVVWVTAVHTLTQSEVDAGKVINQAKLSAEDPEGNPVNKDSDDPSTTKPNDATITQIVSPGSITLVKTAALSGDGNTIDYTFTVKNTGIVTLDNVTISDTKIVGDIAVNPSTLAPGETGTATAVYTITAIEKVVGQVSNTAIVTGTSPNGFKVNDVSGTDESNNIPTLQVLPKITGTKTVKDANGNGIIEAGEVLTYTISVINDGDVDRRGVSISDMIPAHTIYEVGSASNGGALIANTVNWNNLTVPAKSTLAVSFKVNVDAVLPLGLMRIKNIANVINPAQPIEPIEVETSQPTEGKLESTKMVSDVKGNKDGIAQANEILTYSIVVKNSGGSTLNGIKVSDVIPVGLTYVNASASHSANYTAGSHTLNWLIDLAPDASATLTFDATVAADVNGMPELENIADVLSPTGQTLTPSIKINVDPSADLVVTKNLLTPAPIQTGDRITYQINVINLGQNKATGVKVSDVLPGTLDAPFDIVVSKGTSNYTAIGKELTWTIGDLALNESVTITFKTRVVATGTLVNIANVTADQPDRVSNNNRASSLESHIGGEELLIPNLFTPNGDGNNDAFEIKGLDQFGDNDIVIVNRWGNEVFRTKMYQNNWTGEGLNEGTYYYVLRVKKTGSTEWKVFKGYITLIRAFKN